MRNISRDPLANGAPIIGLCSLFATFRHSEGPRGVRNLPLDIGWCAMWLQGAEPEAKVLISAQ